MNRFVLDASVALAWFLDDEFDEYAARVADALRAGAVPVAPSLWAVETTNAVLKAERKGRVHRDMADQVIALLKEVPVVFDESPPQVAFDQGFAVARMSDRSAYDALYLELAIRLQIPLASSDLPVREAAKRAGVRIFLA